MDGCGGMSGYDLVQWIQNNLPQCKILLTSGFNEQISEMRNVTIVNLRVRQAPCNLVEL